MNDTVNLWQSLVSTELSTMVATVPLFVCSVLILAIIIERLFNLRARKLFSEQLEGLFVNKIKERNFIEAKELVSLKLTLQQRVYFDALTEHVENQIEADQAFVEHGTNKLHELVKWLPHLRFISKVAPLLGLLGTVLGMIQAFSSIALNAKNGNVDIQLVSNGIGTALTTTALGLIIAIPAMTTATILTRIGERYYEQFEGSLKTISTTLLKGQGQDQEKEPNV